MSGGELNRERQELVDLAGRYGLPQMVSGEPFPPSQAGAPLVVNTDAGGDPDDAVALVFASTEGLVRWAGLGPATNLAEVLTTRPEIEIRHDSDLHRRLARPDAPPWARLLAAHRERWFDRFHPGTMQHDALALSVRLQLPYVGLLRERVVLDAIGRVTTDPGGHLVRLSVKADYRAFLGWLTRGLDAALTNGGVR